MMLDTGDIAAVDPALQRDTDEGLGSNALGEGTDDTEDLLLLEFGDVVGEEELQ